MRQNQGCDTSKQTPAAREAGELVRLHFPLHTTSPSRQISLLRITPVFLQESLTQTPCPYNAVSNTIQPKNL